MLNSLEVPRDPCLPGNPCKFPLIYFPLLTELSPSEVVKQLKLGCRLPHPSVLGFYCDEAMFNVMSSCWTLDYTDRPTFRDLCLTFEDLLTRDGDVYSEIQWAACNIKACTHTHQTRENETLFESLLFFNRDAFLIPYKLLTCTSRKNFLLVLLTSLISSTWNHSNWCMGLVSVVDRNVL